MQLYVAGFRIRGDIGFSFRKERILLVTNSRPTHSKVPQSKSNLFELPSFIFKMSSNDGDVSDNDNTSSDGGSDNDNTSSDDGSSDTGVQTSQTDDYWTCCSCDTNIDNMGNICENCKHEKCDNCQEFLSSG
ncbi:hypothetical protein F5Y10DRAFT_270038 [Nemania abortiva]|nr:hypothetical protein F5Y10DRAFT_270038 [Nemania abortiva]